MRWLKNFRYFYWILKKGVILLNINLQFSGKIFIHSKKEDINYIHIFFPTRIRKKTSNSTGGGYSHAKSV